MLNGSSWDETDAGLQLIKVRLHHIQRTAIRGKRLKNLPRILLDLGRARVFGRVTAHHRDHLLDLRVAVIGNRAE